MIFSVISIFPELFTSFTKVGVVGRAFTNDVCKLFIENPRDFVKCNYKRIDDKAFGGNGQIMMIEPLKLALSRAYKVQQECNVKKPLKVMLSPQGKLLSQNMISSFLKEEGIIFVCGRYDGVDERFIENYIDIELSIGDFVVSGGEIPAMATIDAIVRQIPGVLGNSESYINDSFANGLLNYPKYTKPQSFEGREVPSILLSGDHKQIDLWRLQLSLWTTYLKRPELLQKRKLTKYESGLLDKLIELNLKNK